VVVQKQNPGILPDIAATKVRNQHAFTWVGYEKLSESHFHENARRRQLGLIENNVSIQAFTGDRSSAQEQFSMRVFEVKPAPPLGLV